MSSKKVSTSAQHEPRTSERLSPPLAAESTLINMRDACRALSLSKPTVYDLIEGRILKTFLIGNRRFTTAALLHECVEGLAKRASKTPLPSEVENNRHRPKSKASRAEARR